MREIKFRDFDLEKKVMNYYTLDEYDRNENDCYGTIMQYTGLKDKVGKEIYEGDVLHFEFNANYKVVWSDDQAGWFLISATGDGDKYGVYTRNIALYESKEVIGNIYENPELLNK